MQPAGGYSLVQQMGQVPGGGRPALPWSPPQEFSARRISKNVFSV